MKKADLNKAHEILGHTVVIGYLRTLGAIADGITLGEIEEVTEIPKTSLSRYLKEMWDSDMVRFEIDEADRRRRPIYLTMLGRQRQGEIFP